MALSADHEVIDSPEALLLHLYEAHNVEEARDLDPESAPLQFWLRRHAELEREGRPEPRQEPRRSAAASASPPSPPSSSPGSSQPRARPFADPLVEAVAVTLAGRGHDERAVRATIASYGERRLRARLLDPLLDDITAELRGGSAAPARRPAGQDDDVMALVNVLQHRRGGRPEGPARRRTGGASR